MYTLINLLSAALIFFAIFVFGCDPKAKQNSPEYATFSIKRGQYLVTTLGCNDCHSTKKLENGIPTIVEELRLAGYPSKNTLPAYDKNAVGKSILQFSFDGTSAYGPWGLSLASNLTPDETGIGTWNYEQFKRAITKGKYKGLENARLLNPPMPWQNYTQMNDEDVQAIFNYLKSIKPVRNIVPNAN